MAKPTLRTERFAEWLVKQRNDRSFGAVAALARKAIGGVLAFDRSSWKKLEEGQVPNVIQLWGISRALNAPFMDVARQVLQDLDVPVDEPARLRDEPPLSPDALAIARRYARADSERRRAARFVLSGQDLGLASGAAGASKRRSPPQSRKDRRS